MSENASAKARPLSPHLSVYRPQITSVLSISHRATGVAMIFGFILIAIWVVALAIGEGAFNSVNSLYATWLFKLAFFAWSFALYYHFCNGIRHLFWDAGRGFALENVTRSGIAVLVCASVFTIITWVLI